MFFQTQALFAGSQFLQMPFLLLQAALETVAPASLQLRLQHSSWYRMLCQSVDSKCLFMIASGGSLLHVVRRKRVRFSSVGAGLKAL